VEFSFGFAIVSLVWSAMYSVVVRIFGWPVTRVAAWGRRQIAKGISVSDFRVHNTTGNNPMLLKFRFRVRSAVKLTIIRIQVHLLAESAYVGSVDERLT